MNNCRGNGLFKNVPDKDWNDWKWQVKNRIETLEDLTKMDMFQNLGLLKVQTLVTIRNYQFS